MNNKDVTRKIFFSLVLIFCLLLMFFFVPLPDSTKNSLFPIIGVLGLIFMGLGIALAIMARKEKGKLRVFLIITGISATAPFVGTILHNFFYALAISFERFSIIFEFLHGTFFIISLLVAPIMFIIGLVGSIILFNKRTGYKIIKK